MATYIPNNNYDNINQSLQFLAQQNARRKAQDLETAMALNRMGKNKEAEELLLSSQRGILGNLFGKDAEEWQAQNPYAKENMGLKQLISSPEADRASAINTGELKGKIGLDTEMITELEKQYKGNPEALKAQIQLMGLQSQGASAKTALSDVKTLRNQNLQNADISNYNKKAEAFNKANDLVKKVYSGNEIDQQQQLIDDTMLAMENAASDSERLKAYNKYYTTGKAVSDHYGHKFDAQSPAYFGIGANKGSGKGVEMVDYYYGTPGSTSTDLVQIPKYMLGDDSKIQAWISKKYNRFYSPDKALISKAGTDQGGYLNPLEATKKRGEDLVYNSALADQIQKQIDESGTGLFTRDSVKEQNFRNTISKEGLDITKDPITGRWKIVPLGTTPASNGGEMKHLDKFRVR
jgi:hypothetical protein